MDMIEISTPRDARWVVRFTELRDHVQSHGALPKSRGEHKVLSNWVRNQRSAINAGGYPDDRHKALATIPGALETREIRVEELARFQALHGRTPKITSPDPMEQSLAQYLIHSLRPAIREDRLSAATLARARAIPGVASIRVVPDQDRTLKELRAYVDKAGHLPPQGGRGTPEENRLASWVRNNTAGDPEAKTPQLRARHLAINGLAASVPAKSAVRHLLRLADFEAFIDKHGHRPGGHADASAEEAALAGWAQSQAAKNAFDKVTARRFARARAHPSRADFLWMARCNALQIHASVRGLPTPGDNRSLYYWLAAQRHAAKKGRLPEWKIEKLLEIPSVLPTRELAAAA